MQQQVQNQFKAFNSNSCTQRSQSFTYESFVHQENYMADEDIRDEEKNKDTRCNCCDKTCFSNICSDAWQNTGVQVIQKIL